MNDASATILIVEDSLEDFEATRRALRKAGATNALFHCHDGDEALDFLFRRGPYRGDGTPLPSLILLDLNLPGTDGREVLRAIKASPELRVLPVVVVSTSTDARDIERSYREGAGGYIQKPVDFGEFERRIGACVEFWLKTVVLPTPGQRA